MDPRLFRAARLGDIDKLNALLEEDPLILEKVSLAPIAETPLHIAALAGKTDFAIEIVRRMPSFAWELNQDGFSPMHIASATGNTEVVRALLTLDHGLCQLKDKSGRTPLHYAAIKGRVWIIEELLSHCPHAVMDVTPRGETTLHLAVKNNQLQALRILLEWLQDDRDLINAADEEGNSIFEIAVATKKLQVVELLHGKENLLGVVQVPAASEFENQSREKSLKIVEVLPGDQTMDRIDTMSQESQVGKGKMDNTNSKPLQQPDESKENKPDIILLVASLIATVTYQAGLSPPPTIWKEGMKLDPKCMFHRPAGKYFLASTTNRCPATAFYLFMSFNTAGFFFSMFLIIMLFLFPNRSPTHFLLIASLTSMMVTYLTLALTISPNVLSFLIIYLLSTFIFWGYCVSAIMFQALALKVPKSVSKGTLSSVYHRILGLPGKFFWADRNDKVANKLRSMQRPTSEDVTRMDA